LLFSSSSRFILLFHSPSVETVITYKLLRNHVFPFANQLSTDYIWECFLLFFYEFSVYKHAS
jgi:hypothetical protein